MLPAWALTLQAYLFKWDPKITELLNSKLGKYLTNHPFITLVLLVFCLTASVPIFLVFAAVFLLTIGGVTLLCVVCCLAVISFWISCIFSILYTIVSHFLNYSYYSQSASLVSKDMETRTEILTPSNLTSS